MSQDSSDSIFSEFTNLYPVQKTLRFALKSLGKTEEMIEKKNLLVQDEELSEKYKLAKKVIDEYHKEFINERLKGFTFSLENLSEFEKVYHQLKKNKNDKTLLKKYQELQKKLRKQVADNFKNENLFKKDLFTKDLPKWLDTHNLKLEGVSDPKKIIEEFKGWTTYFKGFNENRKNIYTAEDHSTAISYRIVHENLPKFLDNCQRIKQAIDLHIDFSEVEELFEVKLKNIFTLEYFNQCLDQTGIDFFNTLRGGVGKKDGKEQGINEKINLFAQTLRHKLAQSADENKEKLKEEIKKVKSCTVEKLYKQILSDRSQISFRLHNIQNDGDLVQQIGSFFFFTNEKFMGIIEEKDKESKKEEIITYPLEEKIRECLTHLEEAYPDHIYLKNDLSLTNISKYLFGDWSVIKKCLEQYSTEENLGFDKEGNSKKLTAKEQEKWLKKNFFSFFEIHEALGKHGAEFIEDALLIKKAQTQPLYEYFKEGQGNVKNDNEVEVEIDFFKEIKIAHQEVSPLLQEYLEIKDELLKRKREEVQKIKKYLDSIQNLFHFIRPLELKLSKKEESSAEAYEKDSSFYSNFDEVIQSLRHITSLYNQTRNYLTKKPYKVEKYKLNFENGTLADGWDKNKEKANACLIFRKDGLYYLGIMDKQHKDIFSGTFENSGECYEKMDYKQIANASKDIQNLMIIGNETVRKVGKKEKSGDNEGENLILENFKNQYLPQNINKIRKEKSYLPNNENYNKTNLISFINYYKERAIDYFDFDFDFFESSKYNSFIDFTNHLDSQGYKVTFTKVSKSYVDDLVEQGHLYLFQIYNKDFSTNRDPEVKKKRKVKDNLHTMYWKALFDAENLKNIYYKLNGEAELFFRKASIEYDEQIWEVGHHRQDDKKKQSYPIIKDKRYATNTYLFHTPITLNFKAAGLNKFNDTVNQFLKNNPQVNIIGLDRGERHLAYYTVINQKGDILKQGSLNNPIQKTNYEEILKNREKDRDKARKSWDTIGQIKNLKEGYLSQVIHKLSKMMIEYNAIILLEDLNFGFKRGRFKVERQVYQKLEKMLIDKLNYLLLKDRLTQEPAGLYRALQLTAPFTSFKKLGKQSGFLFYVPAYHTSKICPATGFVNLLYPHYETIEKSKIFFKKFKKISYHSQEDIFSFEFSYSKFTKKAEGIQEDWTVWSYGKRLINRRNQKSQQWETQKIDLTEEIKSLFHKYAISYESENCLVEAITSADDKDFFIRLMNLLKYTLQLRNSGINSDEDWMISPIKNKEGKFFDSRVTDERFPKNADANGAYHIALKGLMLLTQLNQSMNVDKFKPDLSNKKWYQFVQKKAYLT